ncbi:MAG TPA: hypothetical protein VM509_05805 [Planctomycetota bacterium]|nr:hypothetical protein [Planctomycetota bacterium]
MRVGQVVVFGLFAVTLTVASGAWLYQRSLMSRHAHTEPSTRVSAMRTEERFDRRPAPGGVPPALPPVSVANAPGSVPSVWSEKNSEAIRALERGEHARAIELFEACVAAHPDVAVFIGNLAEALARAAVAEHATTPQCAVCLERLQRAVTLAPDRPELVTLLERWQRERSVEQDFWKESSLHFELSYDGQRNDLLWGSTRLLNELEQAYADLGEHFGFFPVESGRAKFRVVLYERAGFSLLTGLGDWAGGAFDGTAIRIPIGDLSAEESRLKRVFRHELCHAFTRELGGDAVPGWLNEGLSQWLEHDREARRLDEEHAASKSLGKGELIPLADLTGSLASWKDEKAITRAYRQSLAFTGFLWRQYGARAVMAMVAGCKQGRTPSVSFEAEVRMPLADAFEAWSRSRAD